MKWVAIGCAPRRYSASARQRFIASFKRSGIRHISLNASQPSRETGLLPAYTAYSTRSDVSFGNSVPRWWEGLLVWIFYHSFERKFRQP